MTTPPGRRRRAPTFRLGVMGDVLREAWAELAAASDHWQIHHPVRFYAGAWLFGFLAAFVAVWLAGETNVLYPAMTGTGLAVGLAIAARLRPR